MASNGSGRPNYWIDALSLAAKYKIGRKKQCIVIKHCKKNWVKLNLVSKFNYWAELVTKSVAKRNSALLSKCKKNFSFPVHKTLWNQ